MDAIEKCMFRDIAYRMSLERDKMSKFKKEYRDLDRFLNEILQVVDPDPLKRNPDLYDHDTVIDWLRNHYSINLSELARYIDYDISSLRNAIQKRTYKGGTQVRKIPKARLPMVVDYISQYGYVDEINKINMAVK